MKPMGMRSTTGKKVITGDAAYLVANQLRSHVGEELNHLHRQIDRLHQRQWILAVSNVAWFFLILALVKF